MNTVLIDVLIERNTHSRDKNIQFFEDGHKYTILSDPDSRYTSVTTWCHSHFPHFDADAIIESMMKGKGWKEGHKYWGLNANQIKSQWDANKENVSGAGTMLHFEIECFYNDIELSYAYNNQDLYEKYILNYGEYHLLKPLEWQYFINFIKDNLNLKPYRTEWLVYHEDVKIAGSIDMVFENSDGTLSIYDWKRAKNITRINNYNKFAISKQICHLPDSNFWHYALQLNTYKTILEQKYEKKIRDLFLVRLHPNTEELNYELIKLPDLSVEINDLFSERIEKLSTK